MHNQNALMEAALMRLGFSLLAAREFTGNGISNLNRLRTLTEEALDRLIKQIHRDNQGAGLFIPFASQQHVHAIRFWANRMHIIGSPFSIEDVNEPLAEMWGESMKIEREASQAPADLIKVPEPFKKETKWRTWKESVLTYLNSKQGQALIPLSYIIREKDIPERNVIYQTVHDQLVNKAILYGPEYNRNNGIVYDLLQSLTLNGPAWSWISGFQGNRDGRGAWKSLVAYYEGDAMQTRSKQECYDAISKANYQGTKRNFNFSTYVAIHQQAHQDLIRLGEPVPENKKVRDFLQGITDPQCSNIKLNILSNPTFMNNFAQTINYMASAIDMITKNNPNNPRQISELNRNNPGRGNNRGRSYRGRGRSQLGHHNNQNETGRGRGARGRGRGRDGQFNDNRPLTRAYSREEWQNLSQAQRNRVYRERERIETARTVAAMLREDADDVSALTNTVQPGSVNGQQVSGQNVVNNIGGSNISGHTRTIGQVNLDEVSQAFNRRRLNAYMTTRRRQDRNLSSIQHRSEDQFLSCRVELDSHADTCGVNEVARILEYSGQVAEVSGFSDTMEPLRDIPIVKAALAYDEPLTGDTVILIVNQALYFGSHLSHMLFNPNQLRSHGVTVEDIPRHLSSKSSHSIIVNEENFSIPLLLNGVISYFQVRKPSIDEVENCRHITLTSNEEWSPYSTRFEELENQTQGQSMQISALTVDNMEYSDATAAYLETMSLMSTQVTKKNLFIPEQELARRWSIGLKDAENTIKVTSQKFIRSALHPIERRFKTKNVALKYNHLKCRFSSDTFFSNTKSILQNTCAQLFITDFGYAKFTPMRLKSEAPQALKELIQDVGIPSEIHTDGAKELTQGSWKQICQESGIRVTQTEKNSPWQNRTEVEIRELKKHVRRFMTKTQTPLVLWDFCCSYAVELRNRLARPLPQLHGRTPYEVLTGNTPDISEYLEFSWYQPIWYYEPEVFPEQSKTLARWIGIAHRVGQAMCYWVLPSSGVPIARTTIQALTSLELKTETCQTQIRQLDEKIRAKFQHLEDPENPFAL